MTSLTSTYHANTRLRGTLIGVESTPVPTSENISIEELDSKRDSDPAFIKKLDRITGGLAISVLIMSIFAVAQSPNTGFDLWIIIFLGSLFLCMGLGAIVILLLFSFLKIAGFKDLEKDSFRVFLNSVVMGAFMMFPCLKGLFNNDLPIEVANELFLFLIVAGFIGGALFGLIRRPIFKENEPDWF